MENSVIGQNFTTFGLLKFALPSFFTNLFAQLFKSLDDALFVSRYAGTIALAALNILVPLDCIRLAFTHLCSLGASTLSAKRMGEGKKDEARQIFSKAVISALFIGSLVALVVNIFSKPILFALGADEELYSLALYQVRLVYGITPIVILNSVFSLYYSTAGKPKVGMICSIVNGITNISLDIILIPYLKMGIFGAAIASAAGEVAVFIIGLIFFSNKNNEIHFVVPKGEIINPILKSFKLGLPQCINSFSFSVTAFITNGQLLRLVGSDGIAANAIIGDSRSIMMSGLIGIGASIGPVIAYDYGERNVEKLRNNLFSVLRIWLFGSLFLMTLGFLFRVPIIKLFMSQDSTQEFYEMSLFGITIEIFSIIFAAGNIIASRLFIALSNTKLATLLSLCRNLIFRALSLIALPYIFDVTGVWLAIPFAEFLAFCFASFLIYHNKDNYGYGKSKQAYLLQ